MSYSEVDAEALKLSVEQSLRSSVVGGSIRDAVGWLSLQTVRGVDASVSRVEGWRGDGVGEM